MRRAVFESFATYRAEAYRSVFEDTYARVKSELPSADYLFIRYEDLVEPEANRTASLQRLVAFLSASSSSDDDHRHHVVGEHEAELAFRGAGAMRRPKPDQATHVTYEQAMTPGLQRRVWEAIGDSMAPYGYRNPHEGEGGGEAQGEEQGEGEADFEGRGRARLSSRGRYV